VPGYYNGTKGIYLYDVYTKLSYGGTEYFFGRDMENLSVWTVDGADERHDYAPYAGGEAAYTYRVYTQDDPRDFYLLFNVTTDSRSRSNWIETEDVTLYIEYDLPVDAPVYTRTDGTYFLSDMTLRELIDYELAVDNSARFYYDEERLYEQDNAAYQQPSDAPFSKRGRVNSDGVIEYEVIFNNRDALDDPILKKKMKELVFHDTLLTEGMRYVDGSLFCDIYNSDLTRLRATYRYAPDISGSASLNAPAEDFLWYSGDAGNATLHEYAQHTIITTAGRLVFRYQVEVDPAAFPTTEPTVPVSNRAQLTGIMPDNAPFATDEADCTVQYPIEVFKKKVEHTEGSNRADFTITLNPAGVDLLEHTTQMTIQDKMTANLQPVLSTIQVSLLEGGVWTPTTPEYTYDPDENVLSFTLPDDKPIRITYTTLITQTGEGVHIGNSVKLEGFAEYSAMVDTEFTVHNTGGAAHADSFRLTLLKQAADSHRPLPGAVFALYGPAHDERQGTPPGEVPETMEVGGETLWFYTLYTTGADGTAELETNGAGVPMFSVQGLYALREIAAPEGYHLMEAPICFYADEKPDGALPGIEALLSGAPVVAADEPIAFQLPNTGGRGVAAARAFGAALLCTGLLGLSFGKKRRDTRA